MMNSRGKPVDGLAMPCTPAKTNDKSGKSAPMTKFSKMPRGTGESFDDVNPSLKGFTGAKTETAGKYLPLRAQRMVKREHYDG